MTPSQGPSMLPTLNMAGDILLIERLPGWRNRLRVGDIVTFTSPLNPERRAVKRLLAVEGDTICVDPTKDRLAFVQIPKGYVWLQGDNYSNSTDSRTYGPIPVSLLRGRVLACIWPSTRLLRNNAEAIPGRFTDE
ncbi:LexA/Signal peptidase [Martensiomyces pterosporus]|nr:LexA/Signal peptidase [Martensiomyces pterosporus]